MDIEPLTKCEQCRHWTRDNCELEYTLWPDLGEYCQEWSREPGLDEGEK